MQGRDRLLVNGLDGDRVDLVIAKGFEEALGVGAVGLVTEDVGADAVGWEKDHAVTEILEAAAPSDELNRRLRGAPSQGGARRRRERGASA